MKYRFYHYTAARYIEGIKREGLTRGRTPYMVGNRYSFFSEHQWLSTDKDPRMQWWADSKRVPYSRREYRLSINIPKSHMHNIVPFSDIDYELGKDKVPGFNAAPELTSSWFIYMGKIWPQWIERYLRVG